MAYFAEINKENLVLQVIAISNDVLGEPENTFPETEPIGQAFISSMGLTGTWLQTSFNGNFRGTYAGPGYTYDSVNDVFVAPLPPTPEPLPDNEA